MATKRAKSEAKKTRRAELRARLTKQKSDLRAVNRKLEALGPEQSGDQAPESMRQREALRRHRTRLLFAIERTEAAVQRSGASGRRTVVQGPKSGITSIVQGGAPGLGRRA